VVVASLLLPDEDRARLSTVLSRARRTNHAANASLPVQEFYERSELLLLLISCEFEYRIAFL
jgi:hypothetical protein